MKLKKFYLESLLLQMYQRVKEFWKSNSLNTTSYISAKVQRQLFLSHFGQIQIMSHYQNQFAIKL
jgi:hypothetical protein